ncbi:hypothetical protein KI659_05580 [Litoribacter alkaliphilus]|uniref:DUF3575 domain-containing protein n=1 Tax=Litoribacter ruber TaxID=702568 RepID=A0AAP2CFA6_9BACT|nr:hypothetical protein [Litoribacter alkaliphilus]MBS9523488.1 hypothetical protein [Litoribacter alkaliphilus]
MKSCIKILFIILLMSLAYGSHAQKFRNSIYGEVLGNGLFYSINYERNILATEKVFLSPSVGLSSVGRNATGIPVMILAYFGGGNSSLETGLGYTGFYREEDFLNFMVPDKRTYFEHYSTARLGYRYESPKGFLFKVAFTPLYRFNTTYPFHEVYAPDGPAPRFIPSGGIGFGKSF